jgi:hypothetical protein
MAAVGVRLYNVDRTIFHVSVLHYHLFDMLSNSYQTAPQQALTNIHKNYTFGIKSKPMMG